MREIPLDGFADTALECFLGSPAQLAPDLALWLERCAERGFTAPVWPKQYGGMGATLTQQIILFEEISRVGAPTPYPHGLNFIGPLIIWLVKKDTMPFVADQAKAKAEFRNEQAYLSDEVHQQGKLKYWDAAWCASYKYHCIPPWPLNYWRTPAIPACS